MAEEYYIIPRSRLVGFADQARRLSGLSDELSPAQIEEVLAGVNLQSNVPDLPDLTNAIGVYHASIHGKLAGQWSESDSLLHTDGTDDYLSLKLTSVKRVKMKMRPMTASSDHTAYIFDCRSTRSAYLLNYGAADYIGSAATVYANGVQFASGVAGGFSSVITINEWYEFEIVFGSVFTGTMNIAKSYKSADYMKSEIAWIVTYSE